MNVSGIFEQQNTANGRYPPILFINIEDQKSFDTILQVINKEMFLRVRKLSSKAFRKIAISSIGEETELDQKIDYDMHELNLVVDIANAEESIIRKVKMSPFWAVSIIGPRKIVSFYIDKTTEQVLNMRVIDL